MKVVCMYGIPIFEGIFGLYHTCIHWRTGCLLLRNDMDEWSGLLGCFCTCRDFELVASLIVGFHRRGVEWRLDWVMAFGNVIRTFQATGNQ